jgi:hypothetical protein
MKLPDRQFTTVHAEPGARPLWIGLMGPSGGGKTFSAFRLAEGIKSVIGGKIEMIDTESGRGKHYAELFDYEYTAFPPPHGSLDYQAVIEHAVKVNKSSIIIIDSVSHEHEGDGGMMEYHEAELDRMAGDDWKKRDAMSMLAWVKPKAARRQLLRSMLAQGTSVVFILCFRADESSKPVKKNGKTEVVHMGFMPIAGKGFVFECTVCALLMPSADGVPTWNPENVGEKMMKKLPEQFREMFGRLEGKPLSEEVGVELAKWSLGGSKSAATTPSSQEAPKSLAERTEAAKAFLRAAKSSDGLEKRWANTKALCDQLRDPIAGVDPHLYAGLKAVYDECAAKFAPVDSNVSDTAALVELSKRARKFFVDKNVGDEFSASEELETLTSGGCKAFALLATYLANNRKFIATLMEAMGGGE